VISAKFVLLKLYKEHYDAKVARESSIPPYISLVADILDPTDIYVDFENIAYRMESLPRAIDICFKAYNLFQIQYSPAARLMWQFINAQFYQLKDISPQPAVHMLVKNIAGIFSCHYQYSGRIISKIIFCSQCFLNFLFNFLIINITLL